MENMNVKEIIDLLKSPSKQDVDLILKAFMLAQTAHDGQKRLSGEPYLIHGFHTAKILAEMGMSAVVVSAGLLHLYFPLSFYNKLS